MIATDMSTSGSPEEKLRWAFQIYDKDRSGDLIVNLQHLILLFSGSIDLKEMTKIMGCLFELEGIGKVKWSTMATKENHFILGESERKSEADLQFS